MNKTRILLKVFSIFLFAQGLLAQTLEKDKMLNLLDLIRKEKFDHTLPQAMRDNTINMWIHVMGTKNAEEGNLDPLRLDFGSNTGIFIFLVSMKNLNFRFPMPYPTKQDYNFYLLKIVLSLV